MMMKMKCKYNDLGVQINPNMRYFDDKSHREGVVYLPAYPVFAKLVP